MGASLMYTMERLCKWVGPSAQINGRWVPCRGENYKYESIWLRLRDAWDVFRGRADAFTWPEGQ